MESRLALIGIIIEENESVAEVNDVLHNYGQYIIGRMGVPYKDRNLSVISVIIDAELNIINTLSGKLGKLKGVKSKVMYANTN